MEPQEPREDIAKNADGIPYHCESCKYTTKYHSSWIQHVNTEKHKNGGKKSMPPRNYTKKKAFDPNCKHCSYTTHIVNSMTVHILTNHSTSEERRAGFKYYCETCDVGVVCEKAYIRHCDTKKHKFRT